MAAPRDAIPLSPHVTRMTREINERLREQGCKIRHEEWMPFPELVTATGEHIAWLDAATDADLIAMLTKEKS